MFWSHFQDWTKLLRGEFTVNEWFSTPEFDLRIFHHGNESGCTDKKEQDPRSDE